MRKGVDKKVTKEGVCGDDEERPMEGSDDNHGADFVDTENNGEVHAGVV